VLYLPINRNWLLSPIAQSVYLACAIFTFALLATLIGMHWAMATAGATALNENARAVVRFLLFPEIIGAAVLWVAMWYFWFSFDQSHYLKKAVSFFLLFFFAPIGTLIYYFVAYRSAIRADPQSDIATPSVEV